MEIFPFKNNNLINNFFFYKKKILLNPYFISITSGAMNGILNNINTIKFLIKKKINIIPHITCININFLDFKNNLYFYYIKNIKNILILKGDKKYNFDNNFYSYNLLNLIKKIFKNYFNIYIALYCEFHDKSFNYNNDFKNSFIKLNFSKIYSITQYFYNIDSYLYFIDDFKKIKKKNLIIPGIMPFISINQIIKFSNICKTNLPLWIIKRLNNYYLTNKEFKILSTEIIINLIFKLINFKISNIHIYSMNNINYINNILEKILISKNV